jgi:hypothetical protein
MCGRLSVILLSFVSSLFVTAGCAVVKPAGWPEPEPPARALKAAAGHMYGLAPTHWDGPGGRVLVDVEDARRDRRGLAMTFSVKRGGVALRCASDASPALGEAGARFECFSESVHFWLAPGAACPLDAPETLQNPACWYGRARLDGQTVHLEHGYMERLGAVVGYLTWTTPSGELLMAADVVSKLRIALYDTCHTSLREPLTLLTVALSWFQHAADALRE